MQQTFDFPTEKISQTTLRIVDNSIVVPAVNHNVDMDYSATKKTSPKSQRDTRMIEDEPSKESIS